MDMKTRPLEVEEATTPKRTFSSARVALIGLALGVLAGLVINVSDQAQLNALPGLLEPFGYLWIRALQMIVYPLVISSLMVAILGSSQFNAAGKIGAASLTSFLIILVSGALFSVSLGSIFIGFLPDTSNMLIPPASESSQALLADRKAIAFSDWLNSLIPTNPFNALSEGHLLPVIIFTVVFGIAVNHGEEAGRAAIHRLFSAIFEAMMTLVRWLLVVAPVAIFILALSFSARMGVDFTTILLSYLVMVCTLLILATLLLYPITCLLGGVSLRTFAAGVLPAQSVALSTRSSLASLPALMEGAKDILKLNPSVANLTLPLAVSVFKTNRTISSTFSLLVLGHIFGLDLGPVEITTFVVTSMILSFSSVGIPMGGNTMLSLPAYLAAGVPLEGYLLLKTVNPISDVPKTLVNVTGDMSVATILNRFFGR